MTAELFEVRGTRANHVRMAAILGVSTNTLSAWVQKEGFPVLRPGAQGREAIYDTRAAFEWWGERELRKAGVGAADGGPLLDARQQKARYDKSRADAQEMKNHLMRRVMVTIDDVIRIVTEHYGEVRAKLMELPGRVAHDLALETDPAAVERRLKDEIAAVLAALNAADVVDPAA